MVFSFLEVSANLPWASIRRSCMSASFAKESFVTWRKRREGEGEVKGSDNIPTSKHCVILIYVCFECLMQLGVQFSISYSKSA